MSDKVANLSNTVLEASREYERYVVGIAGSPASGKSTLARALVRNINQQLASDTAIVVPMDGYHLSNQDLTLKGILHLKGIPASFDAEGFVGLMDGIVHKASESHFAPEFRREIEESVQNAIEIKPSHKIIIVEGNYLLLDEKPWDHLPRLLNEVWFLSVEESLRRDRLLKRHMSNGRTEHQASEKMKSTDDPNAELIESSKSRATRTIVLD